MNGEAFLAYVEQALVPELRPGDVVGMDNMPLIRFTAWRQAIEAVAQPCDICRPTAHFYRSKWSPRN